MIKKVLKISSGVLVSALVLSVSAFAMYVESTDSSVDAVSAIKLSADGAKMQWSVDGYSSQGYKVVWSKSQNPEYPTRSGDKYQYFSDPSVLSTSLDAFDGNGTYYVRVCEYLGGKCGVYSNQVKVSL